MDKQSESNIDVNCSNRYFLLGLPIICVEPPKVCTHNTDEEEDYED